VVMLRSVCNITNNLRGCVNASKRSSSLRTKKIVPLQFSSAQKSQISKPSTVDCVFRNFSTQTHTTTTTHQQPKTSSSSTLTRASSFVNQSCYENNKEKLLHQYGFGSFVVVSQEKDAYASNSFEEAKRKFIALGDGAAYFTQIGLEDTNNINVGSKGDIFFSEKDYPARWIFPFLNFYGLFKDRFKVQPRFWGQNKRAFVTLGVRDEAGFAEHYSHQYPVNFILDVDSPRTYLSHTAVNLIRLKPTYQGTSRHDFDCWIDDFYVCASLSRAHFADVNIIGRDVLHRYNYTVSYPQISFTRKPGGNEVSMDMFTNITDTPYDFFEENEKSKDLYQSAQLWEKWSINDAFAGVSEPLVDHYIEKVRQETFDNLDKPVQKIA